MFLDRIAGDMSEDRIRGLTQPSEPTMGEVQNKIAELRQHPAYLDESHPEHRKIVNQMSDLYKKKRPA
jgi:hypothetical protein